MAAHFGLYEAIILQFLFWIKTEECAGRVLDDGHRYCYNSYSDWRKIYPFISERTLRRTFTEMESKGLICSIQLNSYDRQKLYRISDAIVAQDAKGYFDELPSSHDLFSEGEELPCGQNGRLDAAKMDACTIVHKSHKSFPELKNSGGELILEATPSMPVRKRGRPPKPTDPRHADAVAMWEELYKERFSQPYAFQPKDFKHLSNFLKAMPSTTVSEMRETLNSVWNYEVGRGEYVNNWHRIHTLSALVNRWSEIIAIIQEQK